MQAIRHSIMVSLVVLALLAASQPVSATLPARSTGDDRAALQPLETLLNPDGTLNLTTSFSGPLDPTADWITGMLSPYTLR